MLSEVGNGSTKAAASANDKSTCLTLFPALVVLFPDRLDALSRHPRKSSEYALSRNVGEIFVLSLKLCLSSWVRAIRCEMRAP